MKLRQFTREGSRKDKLVLRSVCLEKDREKLTPKLGTETTRPEKDQEKLKSVLAGPIFKRTKENSPLNEV